MNIVITIDLGWLARPDELARALAAAARLSEPPPAEVPGVLNGPLGPKRADPPRPDYGTVTAIPQEPGVWHMSGAQLLEWIGSRSNSQELLKAAQSLGKSRGYGWRVKSWKSEAVADVYHELCAKHLPARGGGP